MKYFINILSCMFLALFTQTLWAQNAEEMVGNYLNGQVGRGLVLSEDIEFKITSEHVSSVSGVHHIYFSQLINNVQIYGTESSLHVSTKKNTPLAKNRFVKGSSSLNRSQGATLTPLEAIEVAARHLGIEIEERTELIDQKNEKQQEFLFSNGEISKIDIPVNQRYLLIDDVEIVLVWELSIFELSEEHWWSLLLDSNSGAILMKSDKIITCDFNENPESTKVLDYNRNLVNKSNLPGENDKTI